MANQKRLQKAATKFRKEYPELHFKYTLLLSRMANFIRKSGAPEVTVGVEYGKYYVHANS